MAPSVCVERCARVWVWVNVCVFACVFICRVCVCACLRMSVSVCLCVCMSVCMEVDRGELPFLRGVGGVTGGEGCCGAVRLCVCVCSEGEGGCGARVRLPMWMGWCMWVDVF